MTNQLLGEIIAAVRKSEQSKATPLDRCNRVYVIAQEVADHLRSEDLQFLSPLLVKGFVMQLVTEAIMILQSID
jgi:hypothetical protein